MAIRALCADNVPNPLIEMELVADPALQVHVPPMTEGGTSTKPTRRVLTAALSHDAYAGWQQFADQHGITMTASIEAVGLALGDGIPTRLLTEILAIAEEVTQERRSRTNARRRARKSRGT